MPLARSSGVKVKVTRSALPKKYIKYEAALSIGQNSEAKLVFGQTHRETDLKPYMIIPCRGITSDNNVPRSIIS